MCPVHGKHSGAAQQHGWAWCRRARDLLGFWTRIGLLVGFAATDPARAGDPPRLDFLFPAGAQAGARVSVQAGGRLDPWPVGVWSDDSAVVWTATTNHGRFEVEVGAAARPGPHLVRFYTADGVCAPHLFVIGTDPETVETEAEGQPPGRVPATGAVCNGRLRAPHETDTWTVEVPEQSLIRARLVARSIDSPLAAVLTVASAAGDEWVRSQGPSDRDPEVACPVPAGGLCRIAVVGTNRAGLAETTGDAAVYRLLLSTEAYVAPTPPSTLPRPAPPADVYHRRAGTMPLNIPSTSRAYVSPPGRELYYSFNARQGERFAFLVRAGSIGSPLVPRLRVLDFGKNPLVEAPAASDANLVWTAPAAGTYLVAIADASGRGGPGFVCQLVTERPQVHFLARLGADAVRIEPGRACELGVRILRPSDADALLSLLVIDLPAGVRATPVHITGGETEVFLALVADAGAQPANAPFRVLALNPSQSPPVSETARFGLRGRHAADGELLINDCDVPWITVLPTGGDAGTAHSPP